MNLDEILHAFLNPQTVMICLTVYLMTFVTRKVVEGVWKAAKTHRLWTEVFCPIGPIVNGALLGLLAKTFVWPPMFETSLAGRMMYGAICGVFSGWMYGRVRSYVQSAPGKGGSLPPPPLATIPPPPPPPVVEDEPPVFKESKNDGIDDEATPIVEFKDEAPLK